MHFSIFALVALGLLDRNVLVKKPGVDGARVSSRSLQLFSKNTNERGSIMRFIKTKKYKQTITVCVNS